MKKLKNSLPLLLILSLIATMVNLNPAYAQPIATLSVIFPNGTTSSNGEYAPPNTFTVKIEVADITNLFGFDFTLRYNASLLTAAPSVTIGTFFGSEYIIWYEEVNNDVGYVWYAVSQDLYEVGVTGSGTLAIVTFTVNSYGGTILDLWDTKLSDPDGNQIAHEVYDGTFTTAGVPPPAGPVADFEPSNYNPIQGAIVTFDAKNSYDPDGTIVSYFWDFGDKTTATTTASSIDHTYAMVGTYTVTLVVTDNDGYQDHTSVDITVVPSTTSNADLGDWRARPERHHFDKSRELDRGRDLINSLYGRAQNLAVVPVTVKVKFTLVDGRGGEEIESFETGTYTFAMGTYLETYDLSAPFDTSVRPLGKYYVMAQCYYLLGTDWVAGTNTKTFSFTVVE